MYRTTSEMVEGWTKNLALLFPKPVALALWRVLDIVLFFGLPVAALGIYWLQPWQCNASNGNPGQAVSIAALERKANFWNFVED